MIQQPVTLPYASMRPRPIPSLESEEDHTERGGSDNKKQSQQAVYLADLNVCYYQQCLMKTVCQEEDIQQDQSSILKLHQSMVQIKEGLYELQISIQIDRQLIKLNHCFGKTLDIYNQAYQPFEYKTPTPTDFVKNLKKGQRSRPSCVQKAIQSVNLVSSQSPTVSPTSLGRQNSSLLQQKVEVQHRKSSTRMHSASIEENTGESSHNNLNDFKTSTILHQSSDKSVLFNQSEEIQVEQDNQDAITPKESLSQTQFQRIQETFTVAAIPTDEDSNTTPQQNIDLHTPIPCQNIQHDKNHLLNIDLETGRFQSQNAQLEEKQQNRDMDIENTTFTPIIHSAPTFDISLLQETGEDFSQSKKHKSNNLVKNILVGFKTSLTNPRSKIYELMDKDIKQIKGSRYSDFKKKLKQFFKKPRTNLSDIISIFESSQKKDVFRVFIEKYSKRWLDNSPIQDKENIEQFLDFLLLCYSDPNKIKLLSPYRRNKQRNLYRITDSDDQTNEEDKLPSKKSTRKSKNKEGGDISNDDEDQQNNQVISSSPSSSKEYEVEIESQEIDRNSYQIEENKLSATKSLQLRSTTAISKNNKGKLVQQDKLQQQDQEEEETFEEENNGLNLQNQKRKIRKRSSEKLDNSYEDMSEIQSSHQKISQPNTQTNMQKPSANHQTMLKISNTTQDI